MLPAVPLALVAQSGSPVAASSTPFRPPNVIVVVLDDVGVEQLAMYGIPPPWGEDAARTPVLDHLRAQGVMFTHVWAAPLCSPSRAMLLTGRHGFRTGMLGLSEVSGPCPPGTVFTSSSSSACCPANDPTCSQPGSAPVPPYFPNGYALPESEVTLPEALRDAAYPTDVRYVSGAFGKWHLTGSPGDPCHAIRSGFDVFQGHLFNNDFGALDHYAWERVDARAQDGGCMATTLAIQGEWDAERNAHDARAWIDAVRTAPEKRQFFACVSFNPPHRAFQVPPRALVAPQTWARLAQAGLATEGLEVEGVRSCQPGTTQRVDARDARLVYRASLEAVDTLIGRVVLESPEDPDLLENTLVFVVADNGTPDHVCPSTQDATEVGANAPPFLPNHAKFQVYELGVRVPLVVAGPRVAQGATCASLVSLVDLWATIAERAHADVSALVPRDELDSLSFAARLERPTGSIAQPDRALVYTETCARNAFVYDRELDSWTPFAPPASAKYQRAVLDASGFKYVRRVLGADPGCTTPPALCQPLPEEELFRLFDGVEPLDPFETQSLCGAPGSDAQIALMRQRMAWGYSGY